MSNESVSVDFLDRLYGANPDPWDLGGSPYEAAKYEATAGALPRPRYESGVEVGCAIGVLTGLLAQKCDRLLAIDPAQAALAQARTRNAALQQVSFRQAMLPRDGLDGAFDLIVLSEVLYFMSVEDVRETAALLMRHAMPNADFVLVNWLPASDLPLTGDVAASEFIGALGQAARIVFQTRNERYRMDVLRLV